LGNTSVIFSHVQRRRSAWNWVLLAASVVLTLAFCLFVVVYWEEVIRFARYGYIGVLVVSFLGDVAPFVPLPNLLIVFTLGGVLNPLLVGLVAGFGEAIGSVVVYMTGLSSAGAFHTLDSHVMERFRAWLKTRGAISVFIMSAVFNPFFYPFTAIAGMMHFGWWRFLLLCLAGKCLKNVLLAIAGYYGVHTLIEMLGGHFAL